MCHLQILPDSGDTGFEETAAALLAILEKCNERAIEAMRHSSAYSEEDGSSRPDVSYPPPRVELWRSYARYSRRPKLLPAEATYVRIGVRQGNWFSDITAHGIGVGIGHGIGRWATGPIGKLINVLCEGSASEKALKAVCFPIMLPFGIAASLLYFFTTRGWRLFKWLFHYGIPMCCEGFCKCVYSLWKVLTACFATTWHILDSIIKAISQCWTVVIDWLARHAKACLYAIHDNCYAPLKRGIDHILCTPLQLATLAIATFILAYGVKPIGRFVCESCGPACGHAIARGCKALAWATAEVDYAFTGVIITLCRLISEFSTWLWSIVKPGLIYICDTTILLCEAFGKGIKQCAIFVYEFVLVPIAHGAESVGRAIFRLTSTLAGSLWTHVLSPVGHALMRFVSVLGQAAATAARVVWAYAVEPLGAVLYRAAAAVCSCVSEVVSTLCRAMSEVIGSLCAAIGEVLRVLGKAVAATFAMVAQCLSPVIEALCQAIAKVSSMLISLLSSLFATLSSIIVTVGSAVWEILAALFFTIAACVGTVGKGVGAMV
eukprot:CAMPEP_0174708324 /NCGR_PEP_ID=MMETSP1094-20130205/10609_1 /TAXON_ID=156173 /ORGANISM="Chrysochromulina brevifilum, Strain UTEX LB 985" /LENGTH=547 /DNA_ID=CAMNT_0015906865 /DNA_START=285 /DNA_END=1929 /DNA_ORIENTATION=+